MSEHGEREPAAGNFSYTTGYVLALMLTGFSFACVLFHIVSTRWVFTALIIAALIQVYVHLAFFLHLNSRSTPRWNLIVFGFAMIVIAILVGGSIWIMASANQKMMPIQNTMAMTRRRTCNHHYEVYRLLLMIIKNFSNNLHVATRVRIPSRSLSATGLTR